MAEPKPERPPLESFDRYEIVEVERSQLTAAPYNPRVISEKERAKLKAGIKKLGMLAPIVWNATTGNIVSGHQRITCLDQIYGTKSYKLKVARVELDEKREKEANVLMNNPQAQGAWELAKLEELVSGPEFDLAAAGFDAADVYRMFGSGIGENRADVAADLATAIDALDKSLGERDAKVADRDVDDFFVVLVFKTGSERNAFLTEHGFDENRYQSGEEFGRRFGQPKSGDES